MNYRLVTFIAATAILTFLACERSLVAEKFESPATAEASLEHFQLHPDCKIELAAAEPEVIDPVAISFDERGRMWVVEMRDYPYGPKDGEKPKSRIRILEDKDHDGRFETSTVFADELLFATGLQLWQNGAFVTVGGKVVLLRDTDGDSKSDSQEFWYEGFEQQNSQLRANHPTLGMDGMIYVANGLRGGTIKNVRKGGEPVQLSGMDFAFDPHTGECQAVSGVGQFGLTFDRFGNRFVCSNRNPLIQIVIENRYVQRAKNTRIAKTSHDAAIAGADSRVYPISKAWTTSNLHAGQFTAACGVKIFGGTALGDDFFGNAFTCEPTGNLLHREIFQPTNSPALSAKPARDGVEFLASPDTWFRPVNTTTGPDGSMYVVDMYRAVIEHPDWMPNELKTRPDLLLGNDKGRIYCIAAKNSESKSKPFAETSLVENLESNNQWKLETAFRLVLQDATKFAKSKETITALRGAMNSPNESTKIRALWLLKHLNQLKPEEVVAGFKLESPHIKRQSMIIAESVLANEDEAKLPKVFERLARDSNAGVRIQSALSSIFFSKGKKDWPHSLVYTFIGVYSKRFSKDRDIWIEDAVLMACQGRTNELMQGMTDDGCLCAGDYYTTHTAELLAKVAMTIEPEKVVESLVWLRLEDRRNHLARSMIAQTIPTLKRKKFSGKQFREKLLSVVDEKETFRPWLKFHEEAIVDEEAELKMRIESLQVVAYLSDDRELIRKLSLDQESPALRETAMRLLSGAVDAETWQTMMARFSEESPGVRKVIIDIAAQDPAVAKLLLERIGTGKIPAGEVDRTSRGRLMKSRDEEVASLAKKLLGSVINSDRAAVLAKYESATKLDGNSLAGQKLFQKNCSACHQFGEIGQNVGPDISDTRTKTKEQLLHDILNPNGAIDANFISYMVQTFDGKSYAGVIDSENASSITLKMAEGKTVSLLRTEIEEMASTGQSLMPEGFEKDVTAEEMADLLAYLKNWRYLDGAIPFE